MIRLENISKQYGGVAALTDVNLNIPPGQIFGIIGQSGAGKSSLLRMFNVLEQPSSGTVWFQDSALTQLNAQELREARSQIGMIFQHFNLINNKTVYENISLPLKLQGYSKEAIKDAVMPLLELTQMTEKIDFYPAQLSGGQKQRVAIARALAGKPKVLLCDEATSALDPETTKNILNLLSEINKKLNIIIVLITHEMDVVKAICDRVALIEQGKIVRDEAVLDFFLKPHSDPALEFLNTYLNHDIPAPVKSMIVSEWKSGSSPVLRTYFKGEVVNKPLISQMTRQLGLDVNLLAGNIEFIKDQAIGKMIFSLKKQDAILDQAKLDEVKGVFSEEGLFVEVLGYVS